MSTNNSLFSFVLILIININTQGNTKIGVEWIGRFGNNLFQFATVYSVARLKNFNIVACENNDLNVFSLPFTVCNRNNWKNGRIFNETVINGNGMLQPFNKDIYKLESGDCLRGFFQTDRYFIKYRNDLIRLYRFKDETIYERARKVLAVSDGGVSICAHLRLGDYIESLKNNFEKIGDKLCQVSDYVFPVMDYDYYVRAMELVFETVSVLPAQCTLFIVTDDPSSPILKNIKDKLSEHFTTLKISIAEKDSYVNFAMMNLCDVCITSASSFSWWGAWLNTNAKMIISPKYWFNYYVPHKQICLPNDIKMSLNNQYFIESKGYFSCL